jgi:hypothetical protein
MAKITVQNTQITVIKQNEDDYISLTDMLKAKDGEFFFSNWLRNRNTIEFLGIWERLMNPNFNCAEFDIIKSQAGLNRFRLSAKEWTEKTNAIGIISKAGRYGGTYAHKDIAFEFAMWISPEFKVYLIREFQRLLQRFFLTHKEINVAEFARSLGINVTLLRNYINGFKKPSAEREKAIIDHIHKLGREMIAACF